MSWTALDDEMRRWREAAREVTLWWRDDDAVAATLQLRMLLDLASAHEVAVAVAVVPAALEHSLVDAIASVPSATVVQHGYAHRNHAAPGERSCELGGTRAPDGVAADLAAGASVLRESFGAAYLPVIVPPWNRIDAAVVQRLPALGFHGLSTFAPRTQRAPVAGLVQCNTHVDPIGWRTGRRFVGATACCAGLAAHLAARRTGHADADEPTGLLTHHLVFDDAAWAFVADLFTLMARRPGVRWLAAAEAFGPPSICGQAA